MNVFVLLAAAALTVLQGRTLLYCAREGLDETRRARIIQAVLFGLIMVSLQLIPNLWMRYGITALYILSICGVIVCADSRIKKRDPQELKKSIPGILFAAVFLVLCLVFTRHIK